MWGSTLTKSPKVQFNCVTAPRPVIISLQEGENIHLGQEEQPTGFYIYLESLVSYWLNCMTAIPFPGQYFQLNICETRVPS